MQNREWNRVNRFYLEQHISRLNPVCFFLKGFALGATQDDIAKFRGNWVEWMEMVCNTTFANVDDFYSCVESQVYHRDEIIIR